MHPIPLYPGYFLSSDFKIIGKKGKPLSESGEQYKLVNVFTDKQRILYVHRAIALVHVAGYFEGAVVDHIDRNPRNNNPSNLRWVTPAQNNLNIFDDNQSIEKIDAKIAKLEKQIRELQGWKSIIINNCAGRDINKKFGPEQYLSHSLIFGELPNEQKSTKRTW